jgi:hypothetical protein
VKSEKMKKNEKKTSSIKREDVETLAVGIVIFALFLMLVYSFLQSGTFSQNSPQTNQSYPQSNQSVEKEKHYCSPESRNAEVCTMEYRPVCGWFNQSIKCFRYPCAATYSNPCFACADKKVDYWTEGECPK